MTDRRISLVAGWQQKFFGNVEQDAHFWVRSSPALSRSPASG